jgi:hypothetical protein
MADQSFFPNNGSGGGGGSGTTNYNDLTNRPVTNLAGSGIVISGLSTGVYNIDGTWKMTADDAERTTEKDDLFYVKNDASGSHLTWVTAGKIYTFSVVAGGTAADIEEGELASTDDITDALVGNFGD